MPKKVWVKNVFCASSYLNCHSDNISARAAIVCLFRVLFLPLKPDHLSPHVMLISTVAEQVIQTRALWDGRRDQTWNLSRLCVWPDKQTPGRIQKNATSLKRHKSSLVELWQDTISAQSNGKRRTLSPAKETCPLYLIHLARLEVLAFRHGNSVDCDCHQSFVELLFPFFGYQSLSPFWPLTPDINREFSTSFTGHFLFLEHLLSTLVVPNKAPA